MVEKQNGLVICCRPRRAFILRMEIVFYAMLLLKVICICSFSAQWLLEYGKESVNGFRLP